MKANFVMRPIAVALLAANAQFAIADQENSSEKVEEITVVGKSVSYANNAISQEMIDQQSTLTSVMAVIDNLPGVLINEGDTFGTDDWSTTVSIRGFQLSLDEQQIGLTADGIPNGNSNYGGGSKANRYIDTENLSGAQVSQGTADIASRSHEALGGTINFTTIDPGSEEKLVISYTTGDFDAQKYYARYETGEIFGNTRAWISGSSASNSDWVDQVAENTRDHLAFKVISELDSVKLTGYLSYDDTHEDNYQRLYGVNAFKQNPGWDRLTSDWTGIPAIDQNYRRGWSTLRENLLAYIKADFSIGDVNVATNVYYHDNKGRGDWMPPYWIEIVDGLDDNGNPERAVNRIYTDENGNIASSYRHTHYDKERYGINADFDWTVQLGSIENTLRGGFWYEDYQRDESRDWHQILNPHASYHYDHRAYVVQYERTYPVDTLMYYLEDTVVAGPVKVSLGVKQFDVDVSRTESIGADIGSVSIDSDSDVLFSGGVVVQTPVDGLEVFAGYAENFAAVKDQVLEQNADNVSRIEPETAENIDLGLRYENDRLSASLTYYSIDFDNRLQFIPVEALGTIDYIDEDGTYINTGGIESEGLEASATFLINDNWSVFSSITLNDADYKGTGSLTEDVGVGVVPGDTVYGSVEEMAVISFDWNKGNYIAGLSTKWVGERWMFHQNEWTNVQRNDDNIVEEADISGANSADRRIDDYIVSDFYLGVNIPMSGDIEEVSIRATVNNIFDESYLAGTAGSGAWIGAPRTAAINISASF